MANEKLHPFFLELHALAAKHNVGAYATSIVALNEDGDVVIRATGATKLDGDPSATTDALKSMFEALRGIRGGLLEQYAPKPPTILN